MLAKNAGGKVIKPIILATRFGYGVRRGAALPVSVDDVLDALNQPDQFQLRVARPTMQQRITLIREMAAAGKAFREGKRGAEELNRDTRQKAQVWVAEDMRAVFVRAAFSEQGFRERLVAFWSDHFTVAGNNLRGLLTIGAFMDEAIRPKINGQFSSMLKSVVIHPAMLYYLDQVSSVGPNSFAGQRQGKGLNENLAREVLELHTLGVGGAYTQTDVRQFAELLTGLQVDKNGMKFNVRSAEPLQVQILGKSYRHSSPHLQDIMDFLDDLAVHPETAKHIATKLAVHFVAETPDPDLIDVMARAFKHTNGNLHAVYKAMLEHPASGLAVRQKIKQPVEFMISAIRAMDIGDALKGASFKDLRTGVGFSLQAMGQEFFNPSGPDGWSEKGSDWITPPTLTVRIEWAVKLSEEYGQDIDPRELLTEVLGDVSPELEIAVTGAETKWEGVALMLASPEFNRR